METSWDDPFWCSGVKTALLFTKLSLISIVVHGKENCVVVW